ncbi:MAG TPA: PEP-CTERM sorting domain-containing protein [Phycisphaerae bacterium]|nr:PEP-CTERM sorting domain-containing protein [Phycisphaerae bacterium]HRW54833.1 PEP-CTERM sorting domain-containing protein [Phycisphaerae bacterium]
MTFRASQFGCVVWLCICAFAPGESAVAAQFQGLGDFLGGDFSSAVRGVSGNGAVVVGFGTPAGANAEGYRWTPQGGLSGIGFLNDPTQSSRAFAASFDGQVIVGSATTPQGGRAIRQVASGALMDLGDLENGAGSSSAYGVSADGSVVAGSSSFGFGSNTQAFRWEDSSGIIGLGMLPGFTNGSSAWGISASGEMIVGSSLGINQARQAYKWTQAGGMVALGDLPGGDVKSVAKAVSADMRVIVGQGHSDEGFLAVRWTEAGGIESLGDLPGGLTASAANAVNGDGSVIVGGSLSSVGTQAMIWTEDKGMRSLQSVLVNDYGLGAELLGWRLLEAQAISQDGLTIAGDGLNPNGLHEGWVVRIPEPTTATMTLLAGAILLTRRRRRAGAVARSGTESGPG